MFPKLSVSLREANSERRKSLEGYKQSDEPPDFLHFERLLYVAKQPLDLHKKDQLIGLLVTLKRPNAFIIDSLITVTQKNT